MTDITAMRVSQYVQQLLEHSRFDNLHELNAELVLEVASRSQVDERYMVESLLTMTTAKEMGQGISTLTRALAYIEAQIESIGDIFDGEERDVIYMPVTDSTFMFSTLERQEFDQTYQDLKGRRTWAAINSLRSVPAAVILFVNALGEGHDAEFTKLYDAALRNEATWYVTPTVEGGVDANLLALAYQAAVEAVSEYRGFLSHNPDYHITFRYVGEGMMQAYLRRKVA